jgi:hypothetical protein
VDDLFDDVTRSLLPPDPYEKTIPIDRRVK